EYTDLGLEVLAEVLRRPAFDPDKIDLAKVQVRSGIARRNDDIATLTRREWVKQVYGANSVFARHTEYETVASIERDDIVAFHKAVVQPENIQIAIYGDFKKKDILAKLNTYFGDWKKGGTPLPPLPGVDYEWGARVYYIEKTDVEQSYVRVGHLGGTVTDPDYAARIVMSTILGGGFGSRLTNNVRTKLGLAYSTGGRYIANESYPGYFFAIASTKPQSTIQAAREMLTQIRSMITDMPTAEEMEKGKDGYLNSFVFNFDSRREVLNRMMNYDYYGLPEDFLQKEKEGVEQVTPEAVMAAAKANIRPEEMIIVIAGNKANFDEPISALGFGEPQTIDITIPSAEEKRELAITPENLEKGAALLTKMVGALGGQDKFKAIKSVSSKGTVTLTLQGRELPLQVDEIQVLPTQSRQVISFMGQKMYDIRNNDSGWKTDQRTGEVVAKTAEDLADDDKSLKRDNILIFQKADDPGCQVVYDGTGDVEGVAVEYVALIDDAGDVICRFGVGAAGDLVCKDFWGETPMGEGSILEMYRTWNEVNGVKMPATLDRSVNGEKFSAQALTEIVINPEIPAGSFDKPE
ncbi:MAG: insulinase family protein, partial [candidate division Zixibacteria bacterium]|nr:insulinase family protein [candidate division Zixibacteria bacterium]